MRILPTSYRVPLSREDGHALWLKCFLLTGVAMPVSTVSRETQESQGGTYNDTTLVEPTATHHRTARRARV
jgi:hypothetical protein